VRSFAARCSARDGVGVVKVRLAVKARHNPAPLP